jgi:amidohydrolase
MDIRKLKESIQNEIETKRDGLSELCLKIHSNPELGFEEIKAAGWLTEYLEKNGFTIEKGICQLKTSFKASYGKGNPAIAILAEYDALPEVGHACGHNIISTSAVGAGVASRRTADQLGGTILVIGTPAEELYGGKIYMVERGAFDGLDMAMMIHPGTSNNAITKALACQTLDIEFFGKAAHAAAGPEQGINALEAMLLSFAAINSLRQHIESTARVHGIITSGGEAANVVPAYTAGNFIVRAAEMDYLSILKEKVLDCFVGGATASGARLQYKWDDVCYAPMRNNMTLARLFAGNMESLGRDISITGTDRAFGSTDMGNVSQLVPGIHAFIAIADKEVQVHSPEFAAAAASDRGIKGMLDAAKAMAMTVADVLADSGIQEKIKEEFLGPQ